MKSLQSALLLLIISFSVFAQQSDRQKLLMDFDWKFQLGDSSNAYAVDFDDSQWRSLDVPHDWSVEGEFSEDAPGGGRVGYLPTGIGWYRKTFQLPATAKGKKVWIEFDGVYMNSTVWVNGKELGKRPFGYMGFQYDISEIAQEGENTVAVRVDNSEQPNSRWYSGSGIYRHVWLNIANNVHVAQWGTYITTPIANENTAQVAIVTTLLNESGKKAAVILRSIIKDAEGNQVASNDIKTTIKDEKDVSQTLTVSQPNLWSIETPNLYTLESIVLQDGNVLDSYSTTFGIREIRYDANKGFFLNDKSVKMNGVCLHHGGGPVGAAVPERVWERRFEMLKKMGCNAIRTAHNPMTNEFMDLCDRMGFVVMDEIYDEWMGGKVEHGYNKYFTEWSQKDLKDFIKRDRNHPSVVMWSAGNEIGEQSVAGGHEVLKPLIDTFHELDPTRPVTTGNDHIAADGRTATLEFLNMLDIVGYNYMDRWHERRETYNSQDKHDHLDWKLVGTESVSLRGRRVYSLGDDSTKVVPNYLDRLVRPEQLWKFVGSRDYIIGDFMWTGIDYLGEARWPNKNAASGTMDLCGFPKDGYYFYQSQWTQEPVLHVFPHWNWKGREGQVVPVLAFTNCDSVELFVNDKSFGIKSTEFPRQGTSGGWNSYDEPKVRTTTSDLHLTWDVPYEPGVLRAVGKKNGEVAFIKEIRTTGEPKAIRLSVDRKSIKSDARDVAHIKVEVVDENGLVVPDAANLIRFDIQGVGKLIGVGNGDPSDHDSFKISQRKAYGGLALAIVQSTEESGTITITASSEGLTGSSIQIETNTDEPTIFTFQKID